MPPALMPVTIRSTKALIVSIRSSNPVPPPINPPPRHNGVQNSTVKAVANVKLRIAERIDMSSSVETSRDHVNRVVGIMREPVVDRESEPRP